MGDIAPQFMCYSTNLVTSNGVWVTNSFSEVINLYSFPLFVIQLCLVVLSTRALALVLRPLKQPRVIAEMLGGIIIGPSLLGRLEIMGYNVGSLIFPRFSFTTLETVARLGLLYYLFAVGVGIDLEAIRRTGKKAAVIAAADLAIPFILCLLAVPLLLTPVSTSELHLGDDLAGAGNATFANSTTAAQTVASVATSSASRALIGIAMSITSIPVLARILTDVRLLNTKIGRLALSSAIINNMLSWLLLALVLAVTGAGENLFSLGTVWVMASGLAFFVCLVKVVRPGLKWVARRTHEGKPLDPQYVGLILMGVVAASSVSDAIGLHPEVGAFLFGLVLPNGPLAVKMLEMTEESGVSYLLPLFFASNGFKINASQITDLSFASGVVIIFLAASCARIAGTLLVTRFYGMNFRRGLALGFLMNTRGIVQMLILTMGIDRKVLKPEALPLFVLLSSVITALVPPVVLAAEKPSKRQLARHRRRNIQMVRPGSELRLLACLHSVKNVPSLISLLDASNPTKRSPIFVHALHLIELVGRATAMLIVHQSDGQQRSRGSSHAESEHIVSALEQYEQQAGGVSIQTLTAIASYPTMHEDICALAEEKRVNLIILPFYKQPTGDGGDRRESSVQSINQNVLSSARCSVAILVDRRLGGAGRFKPVDKVALLFFGGPDDREALTFGSRMAEHPNIHLTVTRFLAGEAAESPSKGVGDEEKVLDDHCVNEFRLMHVKNESVAYRETVVENSEETVAAVRSIDSGHDLYVVGRGSKAASPLTAGLEQWSERPELGPVGDLLASSDFGALVSVLVFQQYEVLTAEGEAEGGGEP